MIESIEFPQLANKYGVYGVPKTVINDTGELEGAVPESIFVAKILETVGLTSSQEVERLFRDLSNRARQT